MPYLLFSHMKMAGSCTHTRGEVSTTIVFCFRSKASKLRAAVYLPESGHVVRLEKLTLVGGTVTEHGDRDATGLYRRTERGKCEWNKTKMRRESERKSGSQLRMYPHINMFGQG